MSEEKYYGESFRSRFSEKIARSNWLPLMFFIGLAVIATVVLLFVGFALGPPALYFALALTVVIDVLSFWNAKKYGWPVDVITDACVRVGSKLVVLQFPDGRFAYTPADVYYNKTLGNNGWMSLSEAEKIREILKEKGVKVEDLGECGFMQLHVKSDYGVDSSGIYLVQMPTHIIKVDSPVLVLKGVELKKEDWIEVSGKKWPTFACGLETRLTHDGEDKYLNNMHKIAPAIMEVTGRYRYKQIIEEKDLEIKSQEKRIEALLQIIEKGKVGDEAVRMAGGKPQKWYEYTGIRVFVELTTILGIALLFMFLAGVVM